MRVGFAVVLAGLALAVGPEVVAQPTPSVLPLAPHRAVYDLSLMRSNGSRSVDAARGRIALEFGGDECEGYTTKYRQVTVLDSSESGARTLDVRTATFEGANGRTLRFRTDSRMQDGDDEKVDGDASRENGVLSVRLREPKKETVSFSGEPIFPTEHLKTVIAAARAGRSNVIVKVYDGSDNGMKVYDTLALIGHRIEPGSRPGMEEPAQKEPLASLPRWPVTISYFTTGTGDQTPIYVISFELYENGISRALRIDYGDFALRGDLQQLEVSAPSDCRP
ncbi:cell envelope integrity EipB family protein [Microvirga massiliensis]|uniref:cell envelope integrity EipB family protein n=1 Tax=Microvirga massiliensis TaxID=1033741 RepID=UPI00062B6060|nr:cell envelope integrity EipB family protein [Microvirga massiliensis]